MPKIEYLDPRLPERYWDKVFPEPNTGCWLWGAATSVYGYGCWDQRRAHRASYEVLVGPVGDGLVLDHLCRNRACVNPDHLEPVTSRENILRGVSRAALNAVCTHCVNGHGLLGSNLYVTPNGRRQCRACRRDASRAWRARKSVASVA